MNPKDEFLDSLWEKENLRADVEGISADHQDEKLWLKNSVVDVEFLDNDEDENSWSKNRIVAVGFLYSD